MTAHITAQDAQAHLSELMKQVRQTGEPVIIEESGEPAVVLIRPEDLSELQQLRSIQHQDEFSRLAREAARTVGSPEPTDDEIVQAVKQTREAFYRERYGGN